MYGFQLAAWRLAAAWLSKPAPSWTARERRRGLAKPAPSIGAGATLAGLGWLLLLCLLTSGCAASGGQKRPAAEPPATVTIMKVEPADIPIYADFSAQTYARHMVEVRGRVEGYVEQWRFRPGSEVKTGQVLYVLDLRPFQAAVEQARGNLHQAEADLEFARRQVSLLQAQANLVSAQANSRKARQDYERLVPMVHADAASQQDLDAATAALKANQANVDALQANVDQTSLSTRTQIDVMQGRLESARGALRTAELNLQYATIAAPVGGRIGDTLIPVGGLVVPNSPQPLTTIVPLDPVWVRFKVTEPEYLSWSGKGMWRGDLHLVLADGCDFPWKGTIEDSLNQFDAKTGTLELQARFPNPQHTVLPGQFGHVRVQVEERKDVLVVPQRAVQQLQGIQVVYTVGADNRVLQQAVTTGPRVGGNWVIERGLKPGDRIIVEGQLRVRPGVPVKASPYRPSSRADASPTGE